MIKSALKIKGFTKRGFTLIELLIVIAILGILAAAVLIAINPTKRQNQAKDSNVKSDIGSLATAMQAYYTAPGTGSYPTLAQGLDQLVQNQDLKSIPTPPAGGNYSYAVTPLNCDPAAATPVNCADAAIWSGMFEDTTKVWCWQSKTGKAQALLPPDASNPASCLP